MFARFWDHIKKEKFFKAKTRIVLAASGGIDSMCLLELLDKSGIAFEVAHFDHLSRKGDSTKDAQFVKSICKEKNIPFHLGTFDRNVIFNNFQAEARRQRYAFFNTLSSDCLVTAHHYDDQAETVFMNFIQGKSTAGIPQKSSSIVRPLLPYSKSEIKAFVEEQKVDYREDYTNAEDDYLRNYTRNTLFPLIKERLDNFEKRIVGLSDKQSEKDELLDQLILKLLDVKELNGQKEIKIDSLYHDDLSTELLLRHYLLPFGFSNTQAYNIAECLDQVGKMFYSEKYELLVDRSHIMIREIKLSEIEDYKEIMLQSLPCETSFRAMKFHLNVSKKHEEHDDKQILVCPLSIIRDSLTLRSWRKGDRFYPAGMGMKSQSVKKYFTNIKLNRFEKKNQIILCNGNGDIMWICGLRKDERYSSHMKGDQEYLTVRLDS